MSKTIKNGMGASKRNVDILMTLSRGLTTLRELKERCFKKEPAEDAGDRGEGKRCCTALPGESISYVSRQFMERKLKTLEKQGLLKIVRHFVITEQGMPVVERVCYLTDLGFYHVRRSFQVNGNDIRYGKPPDSHIEHEINLTRILHRIYDDAASGQYHVRWAHADRAMRSLFQTQSGMPAKGMHFLDLRVKILLNSGREMQLPIELANTKDDPDYWKDKIRNIEESFMIISKNADFAGTISLWIQEQKLAWPMYVAPLQMFLTQGLRGTVWQRVQSGRIEHLRFNLDIQQ